MSTNGQPPILSQTLFKEDAQRAPDVALVAYITGYTVDGDNDSLNLRVQVYGTTDMLAASSLLKMASNVVFAADDTNADKPKS